jgi:hypothetical protein
MIKIILNSLPLDGSLASQLSNTKLNDAAESYVKSLQSFTKGKVCSLHPRMNQEITVSAELTRKFTVVKNQFCCDRFSDSIDLTQLQ